jgi:hypothetical protein
MPDDDPTAEQAHHLRARHLLGIGALSLLWFVSLAWFSSSDTGVIVSAGVFAVAVAALSIALLPRTRAGGATSARRWAVAPAVGTGARGAAVEPRCGSAYWSLAFIVSPLVAGPAWIARAPHRAEAQA